MSHCDYKIAKSFISTSNKLLIMSETQVIPKGSIIFVTGAAGLVGAAVSSELLRAGFKVRASTRSLQKAEPLKKRFDAEFGPGLFELIQIEDFSSPGAYDKVLQGVSGVVHVAGDISFSTNIDHIIKNTIDGIHNILNAASKVPTIKRFVMTSSRIVKYHAARGDNYTVEKAGYFEKAVKLAHELPNEHPDLPVYGYAAGKIEGDKAAWRWVKEHKPSFVLNSVLPDMVTGEIINPGSDGSSQGSLNRILTHGDATKVMPFVKVPSFYIDAKDVARIHLAALTEPDVQNEELWAIGGQFTLNQILDIWREAYPNRSTISKDYEEALDEPCQLKIDTSRELELLKRQGRPGWVSLKDTILEGVKGLNLDESKK